MPQAKKTKRAPVKRASSTRSKAKSQSFYLSRQFQMYFFIAIFALIGVYFIWKSFAATQIVYNYTSVDEVNSHCEDIYSDSSKKTSVYEINRTGCTSAAQGIIVMSKSVAQAVYKACVFGKVTLGTPNGTFAAKHSLGGSNLASVGINPTNTSKYDQLGCISVTHNTSDPLIFTITNSDFSSKLRISYVTLDKTGTVPTDTPPDTGGTDPVGVPGSWTLKYSDEFDGSSLNQTNWQPNWALSKSNDGNTLKTKPVNSAEDSCYDPANVSVSNGNLLLKLDDRNCTDNRGTSYPYTGSTVTTYNRKVFSPDGNNGSIKATYFEARVKYPGNGSRVYNWPAWWVDGNALNWPTSLEFDIAESLSGGAPCFTLHSPSGASRSQCKSIDTTKYHTYGMYWQRGKLTAYYDGIKLGDITSSDINYSPQFLIFGNQIDTDPNRPFLISAPTTVYVDYVRVWDGAPN